MHVQEDATTSRTGGTVETLAKQLAEASLSDPEAVVQDPLISWPVQVSRREAKKAFCRIGTAPEDVSCECL